MRGEPIVFPYLVTAELLDQPCAECQATGRVQSEAWAEWIERFNVAERREIAAGRSYISSDNDDGRAIVDVASEAAGPEPDEPEELTCGGCAGVGLVPTEVGEAILRFVTRHTNTRR